VAAAHSSSFRHTLFLFPTTGPRPPSFLLWPRRASFSLAEKERRILTPLPRYYRRATLDSSRLLIRFSQMARPPSAEQRPSFVVAVDRRSSITPRAFFFFQTTRVCSLLPEDGELADPPFRQSLQNLRVAARRHSSSPVTFLFFLQLTFATCLLHAFALRAAGASSSKLAQRSRSFPPLLLRQNAFFGTSGDFFFFADADSLPTLFFSFFYAPWRPPFRKRRLRLPLFVRRVSLPISLTFPPPHIRASGVPSSPPSEGISKGDERPPTMRRRLPLLYVILFFNVRRRRP